MRRTICFALALILTVSLLPLSVFAAETAPQTAAAMTTDLSVFTDGFNTASAATVWYGGSAWRVIGYDGAGVASENGAATLFASVNFGVTDYSFGGTEYWSSALKNRIDNIEEYFSPAESAAVRNRLLTEENDEIAGAEVNVNLWPLSVSEAEALNESIAALDPEHRHWAINCWWLRTPGNDGGIAAVLGDGVVQSGGLDVYRMSGEEIGVRPAFMLDCESVLFVSRAEGGKSSGAVGADAILEIPDYTGSDWKLTVLDSARSGFTAYFDSRDGDVLTVKYRGAKSGDYEYISAVIVNSSGVATRYGRLAEAESGDNNTVTVNLAGKMNAGDKLYIFNEQANGDYMTDYASSLQLIEYPTLLTVKAEDTDIYAGEDMVITVALYGPATGLVTVSVNGVDHEVEVRDGGASLTLSDFEPGEYLVVASYAGEDYYSEDQDTTRFWVHLPETVDVKVTAGEDMTKTTSSGAVSQTVRVGSAMTAVVYTANDGYYFPENYSVDAVNGVTVTRDSFTQITVSGTPTANAAITLTSPTAKTEATVDTDLVLYTYSKIYDGKPISVEAFHNRVNDDENVYFTDKVALAYYEVTPDGDVLLDEAPRDAGSYRAVGTLAAHGKYKAAEESIEFTIEKRPFTLDVQFQEAYSDGFKDGVIYQIKPVNVVEGDLDHFPIVLVVDPVLGTTDEYVMTGGSLTAIVEYSPVSDAFRIEALGDENYRFVECPNQGLKPDLANRRLYAGDCRAMLFDGSLEIEVSCDYPGENDVYSFHLIEGKSVSVDFNGHADILCAGVSLVLVTLSDQAGLYNPATIIIPVFVEKGWVEVHPDFSGITPYNGLPQPVPYTLRYGNENENGSVSVQYDGFVRCEYYEKAAAGTNSESVYGHEWSTNHNIWTAPKDAGEYYALYRAVDTENFNAIGVGDSFVIDPAELEVVTYDAVEAYSGKPVTGVGEIKGLVNGETATLNLTGSQTDVGVSDNTYELVWDGTAKPKNYYVDPVYIGMLKVMEAPLEVVTYDAVKIYSGKPLTSGGDIKGLVNGETVTFTVTGSQTDVGESDNTYTLTWDGTAKPENYYVDSVYLGQLKVIEAPLEVVTYDAFEPYSGKPLTAGGELKGLVNGETVTFTVTGSQTDAGETYNTYTITWDGTAKPDNYYVRSKRLGVLSVGKKALDVITYGDSKDYDGTPLTAGGEVTGLVNGETVTLNLTGSQTVAGESQNTYELIWDGTAKKDNYELIEFIGTLTVYKARPDFTFLDDIQDFPFIVGMTLGEIELPEGWSWLSAADEPLTEGEQVLELAFDLGDVNYITAVGIIDVTVMAPGYRFDAEAEEGYAYTIGDGEGLVLTVFQTNGEDKAFENFSRLLADGVELTKDADYTAEKGSVIITLPAETLEALGAGEHTVTAEFTNGEVSVTVTVNKVPAPADAFDLFLGVMLLAACGAVVTALMGKKRA